MGVENLVHTLGRLSSHPVDSVLFWASPGHSGPGFFGTILVQLGIYSPWGVPFTLVS